MKTEVVMKRELFGGEISQKSKSGMFSATDLVRAGNRHRIINGQAPFDMQGWFQQKGTKEFMTELESAFGKIKVAGRGRGGHTWVHPLLFIDMALAISPKLKIEVYQWLHDNLLKYRNDSGDSYKRMCGALYTRCQNYTNYPRLISEVAGKVKQSVGVDDWNGATEAQLDLRDKIHNNIALLANVTKDLDTAIRCGIQEAVRGERQCQR
jgi:hypothetical protein